MKQYSLVFLERDIYLHPIYSLFDLHYALSIEGLLRFFFKREGEVV